MNPDRIFVIGTVMGTRWENNEAWFCSNDYIKYAKRHYMILRLVCGEIFVRLQESVPIFLGKTFQQPTYQTILCIYFVKIPTTCTWKTYIHTYNIPSYTFWRSTAIIQLQDRPRPYRMHQTYEQGLQQHRCSYVNSKSRGKGKGSPYNRPLRPRGWVEV